MLACLKLKFFPGYWLLWKGLYNDVCSASFLLGFIFLALKYHVINFCWSLFGSFFRSCSAHKLKIIFQGLLHSLLLQTCMNCWVSLKVWELSCLWDYLYCHFASVLKKRVISSRFFHLFQTASNLHLSWLSVEIVKVKDLSLTPHKKWLLDYFHAWEIFHKAFSHL